MQSLQNVCAHARKLTGMANNSPQIAHRTLESNARCAGVGHASGTSML
jgi:hypothetical protein